MMSDYSKFCPKGGNVDRFTSMSYDAINGYRETPKLRPQEDINKELRKLRKALEGLSPDTRELIEHREYMAGGRSLRDFVGNSSLVRLEKFVTIDLTRLVRLDAHRRFYLIQRAAICFHEEGGEVTARVSSPFADYVYRLAEDVGLDMDAPKAIRDFLDKTSS